MIPRKFIFATIFSLICLGLIALFCLITGYSDISWRDVLDIVSRRLKGEELSQSLQREQSILLELRVPRIWLGTLVGGSLSISGSVFQGLLRNPLADPYILGVSSGAILCMSIVILLKLPSTFLPIFALIGAISSLFLVYSLAVENKRLSSNTLLLAGVISNFFFSALLMFFMTKAGSQLVEIINLLMGSLAFIHTMPIQGFLPIISFIIILLSGGLWLFSRDLNALAFGDEIARSMGVDVVKTKKLLFILTSSLVGLSVSLSGAIGFVGLIIPHLVRMIIGPDHRGLMPISFIAGGGFLILCDTAARSLSAVEIPVGVITSFFGAPFFAALLKIKKSSWQSI
ncbi:MAG: hypothetical protein B6244_05320 [Candidatus Cloacimonetes bacterium 4572_55]|nr:MAG: hypothetical protein B6244_05320 [Candidatus Cloacimonetes bacterium 4572_55]